MKLCEFVSGAAAAGVLSLAVATHAGPTTFDFNDGEVLTEAFLDTLALGPDYVFNVNDGAEVEAVGGSINHFDYDFAGSTVNIGSGGLFRSDGGFFGEPNPAVVRDIRLNVGEGGVVGTGMRAYGNSEIRLSGGNIGSQTSLYGESSLTVTDGNVSFALFARENSTINVLGGQFGDEILPAMIALFDSSTLNIAGGEFPQGIGARMIAHPGSAINLFGSSFAVGGVTVDLAPGQTVIVPQRNVALSAILADGTPFQLDLNTFGLDDQVSPLARLTLTNVLPAPGTGVLAIAACGVTATRRRRTDRAATINR